MPLRITRAIYATTLLLLLSPLFLSAQNRDEWSVFSAVNKTQDVAFDSSGTLWIATEGGIVSYDPSTREYGYLRTSEGLLRLNSTAIAFDPSNGDMYVGSDDGSISILKSSGGWKYATEIAAATERTERRINGFGFRDGRVYILTAFGIALYNPADSTIVESYLQFGSFPQYTGANDMLFWRDSIWVATDLGVASAPATGRYLAFPDAWRSYGVASGLTGGTVRSLIVAGDRLLAGDTGGYEYNDGRFVRRPDLVPDLISFASSEAGIVAASAFRLYRQENGTFVHQQSVDVPQFIWGVDMTDEGTIGIGIDIYQQPYSFGVVEGGTLQLGLPNSPLTNTFATLARGDDGAIWTASGSRAPGVSRLREGEWSSYLPQNQEGVGGMPAVYVVSRGVEGAIWAGTSYGGFTRFTPIDSGVVAVRYDAGNSPLRPVRDWPGTKPPVIGGGVAVDENGRTWMINHDVSASPGGPLLVVQLRPGEQGSDGSNFESFLTPFRRNYFSLVIDQSGIKWAGSDGDRLRPTGLLYYDDNGTIFDVSDDKVDVIGESDGLPSGIQTALAIDRDGLLWMGTPKGPAYLANPSGVARSNQQPSVQRVRALVDVPVTSLAIDALNRKWIGTDRGVYVVSADGVEVLSHYTAGNSPLVSDQVLSLLADDATGDIYIGTASGLNRISTPAVRSESPAGPISFSPHPFIVPADESLRISGLPENSSIKILSLNGSLVRELQSPGGAIAFWDGRDAGGAAVPTGIYIVAAGANPGEETVVGKIAVIRR